MDTLERFFKYRNKNGVKEKREIIKEIVDVLDNDKLSDILSVLEKPYFTEKVSPYLVDNKVPEVSSVEFKLLIQAVKYNGIIFTNVTKHNEISFYYLKKFIKKYHLIKIQEGVYIFPQASIDGAFIFQNRYMRSVISHETALYMLGLTNVIPKKTMMSMPRYYKIRQLEILKTKYVEFNSIDDYKTIFEVKYYQNDPIVLINNAPVYSQTRLLKNSYGNEVRVTSPERTIADIFKPNAFTEEEIKEEALIEYFRQNRGSLTRLLRVAKQQNVREKVESTLLKLKLN